MSRVKSQAMAANDIARKVGVAVGVSLAIVVVRRYWCRWQLDQKLKRKQASCRQALQQVEQEVQQSGLSTAERDAIVSLPLATLQSQLQSGELRAVDVVRAYQAMTLEVNKGINCVTEAITEAQDQAVACDRMDDKSRMLHGIPLSVKDNIGIRGYDCTGGLQINIGLPWDEDAVVVQVFKRHGAIPFIKTNIPQAMLSYACSNPIFDATVNPHNSEHTPGGSSGGEGAVIGGGGSIIGLGTDVGGSVRVPAAFCGICALKTTQGRLSKLGVYSVYKGQTLISGVVGPMAKDVASLVVMMRVLTSPDMFELDPSLPPLPFQEKLLNSTHKLRIGYYTQDGNLTPVPVISRAVREAKNALEALGHTLVEFTPLDYGEVYAKLFVGTMVGADQGQTLREKIKDDYVDIGIKTVQLNKLPRWVISLLAKLIASKEPVLGKSLAHVKKDGRTYSWFRQVEQILDYRNQFTKQWQSQGLDAIICPVFASPAPKTTHIGLLTAAGSYSTLYNLVNYTAGVVPVTRVTAQDVADVNNPSLYPVKTQLQRFLKKSYDSEKTIGLPVAVQCATLPYTEELCLRVMSELEAAVGYRAV